MATHDYDIANQSGAAFRTDLNNALAAIQSNNSNSSSPATTVAYQWWADTTNGVLKIRNSSNNDWVELLQLDGTITLENGSASTPALANRSDLNTGVFFSAADNFDISTGGSVRANFSSTGLSVTGAITTTSDITIADKIIHSGDTNTAIRFPAADTVSVETSGSERLRVDSSGRLGVGLTPHTSDVATNITEGLIQTSGSIDIRYSGTNSDPAGARYLNFINTDTSLVAGQPMGGLHWIGMDSNNPNTVTAAIVADSSGNQGTASHLLFKTTNSERMRIDSSGQVGIGVTSVDDKLHVLGSVTFRNESTNIGSSQMFFDNNESGGAYRVRFDADNDLRGSITVNSSGVTYNTSSDYRLKENITAISDGITRLKTLKPSRFNWKKDSSTTVDGFIAHEVTAVPEAVTGTKDAVATEDTKDHKKGDPIYQQIDQSKLVPLLTAALQEAVTKIETLETKVAALEAA